MRLRDRMTSSEDPKKAKISRYIDENLKKVFSDFESDDMPDQILDLLAVLRAQDETSKGAK